MLTRIYKYAHKIFNEKPMKNWLKFKKRFEEEKNQFQAYFIQISLNSGLKPT